MAPDDPDVLGLWERDRVLGTGGFGIVTLWNNRKTEDKVAIKKCRWGVDSLMTATHRERWAREVDIMQRLSHSNVVRAIPVPSDLLGLASELPLLCMEFCSGGDLRQILNKPENCCGLREPEVRCLLSDIKSAVQYLHSQRITHRDLKPENIVLQEKPNSPMIYKLIDLGYAKELDNSSVCCSFVGTMQYLAPEFFLSSGYTSSVDYWSLGLVSHEAITGLRPFLPNSTSPVDWIPKVEKKSPNDICVYEEPGTKDVKYSQQLFVENHISRCLREELERWLRLALQWDPKKRGRTHDNRLDIFNLLDQILCKKIVTVFCVNILASHSYLVDSATAVSTLQLWIERDTKQPVNDQLLLLPSGKQLTNNNLAVDCWNPNEITMLYVFSQSSFTLPSVNNAKDRVPGLVRWLMEHPKDELEYHHQKTVWRHAVFFLQQEHDLYQLFIEAYAVKMLSLLEQSYELSQIELSVSTEVEHLVAMQRMSSETLEFDNKCYGRHLSIITALAGLGKMMSGWALEMNGLAQRVSSYQEALTSMKGRVREAQQITAMLQEYRDPGLDDVLGFECWMTEGYKCYDNLRKRKDRIAKHQSLDMARIVYKCFKQIDISAQNQSFADHLMQLMKCESEIISLLKALGSLKQQVSKSKVDVMRCQYLRQKETWALVKRLAGQVQQTQIDTETGAGSSLSTAVSPPSPQPPPLPPHRDTSPLLNQVQVPPATTVSTSVMSQLPLSLSSGSSTNPTTLPSPSVDLQTQMAALSLASTSTTQETSNITHNRTTSHSQTASDMASNLKRNNSEPSQNTSQTSRNGSQNPVNKSGLLKPGFDLSSRQQPLTHTPAVPRSLSIPTTLVLPKSPLDSESLIQDNINIRYAMQDSILSFTQCSNSITYNDLDWSYLDTVSK
ncbi:inhibitor of nuclear factor kappa-B kinase subunit alpha [Macrosteles quadrilineatus]|uniref:inhibitor of nuclear factor kappa-B kinase subunit alpha n=1 Tax=Macrosteles quadrilineatus TaxID=74068 RepID=UPI0023E258AD|nr:inhibitor of nuclear factor kappa-B kinase subunit alpha [Macrosteles quadrilineatus]